VSSPAVEVARREFDDRRKGLMAWSVGYVAMVLITTASYPSIADNPEIQYFIDELPEALTALIGGEGVDFTTATGYVQSRLLSFVFPIMLLVFVIGFGARAVAGEHQDGRLDLVLSYPVRRRSYLAGRGAVGLGVVTGFMALSMLTLWLGGLPVDLGIGPGELWPAAVMLVAFAAFFGALTLLVSCWRLERNVAIAVPAGLALGSWLVGSLAALTTWLQPVRTMSPLWWLTRRNPLEEGLDLVALGLLVAGAVVFAVAAMVVFDRRDLA